MVKAAWLSVQDVGLWLANFPWCLIYGRQMTTSWTKFPLWVYQPVEHGLRGWRPLKLAGQSCVWLFGRRSKSCGRVLSLSAYRLYAPALSVRLWQQLHCSCSCRLWRYISVMPLLFCLYQLCYRICLSCSNVWHTCEIYAPRHFTAQ